LGDHLIDERLDHVHPTQAALDAASVLAAQPPEHWTSGAEHIAERTGVPAALIRAALVGLVRTWNDNPRRSADNQLTRVAEARKRLDPDSRGLAPNHYERTDSRSRHLLPEHPVTTTARRPADIPK
jgi:hypothetical protein